jgi:protein-S-isoprenylcysteine O-methyltransferase Ste14
MSADTTPATAHRAVGVTAAVLGVGTPVVLAIGWALAAREPGIESITIGALTFVAVCIIGVVALVVGVVAVRHSRPRWVPVAGLVLAGATLLFIVARILPIYGQVS